MAEADEKALVALKELVDKNCGYGSGVSVKKTSHGYETTVFRREQDHSHYEAETMVGSILMAHKAETAREEI